MSLWSEKNLLKQILSPKEQRNKPSKQNSYTVLPLSLPTRETAQTPPAAASTPSEVAPKASEPISPEASGSAPTAHSEPSVGRSVPHNPP